MKNIFNRVVRWFSILIKRKNEDYHEEFGAIMAKLQDIEDLLDIIARELARWAGDRSGE